MTLRVYWSPTPANRKIVEKLSKMPPLSRCGFERLSDDEGTRMGELERVKGKAVFLWGSGMDHGESYHFTKGTGILVKGNYDAHEDDRWPSHPCDSHMARTRMDGVKIIVIKKRGSATAREQFLTEVETECKPLGENQMAATFDIDGLPRTPVDGCLVSYDGYHLWKWTDSIKSLGNRIYRLDAGGVVRNIPDFDFVHTGELPEYGEVVKFAYLYRGKAHDPLPQQTINQIASYATNIYAELIGTFERFCQ